ncbi:constitutive photomorphogenesis protein 10-like isoform X2 [Camellia sinensis]|uniref:constitutive photomorphogenesis protein 10-like isoform X2 n=1 Tax=Camellia sinensis TaxID=4442 RepID=UPI001035B2B7|nr:constitutive photomorphogenesis protein 10-like isoform X2 [Camellia sinensis]
MAQVVQRASSLAMNSSTGTSAGGGGGGGKGRSWPSTTSVSASGKRIQNDMSNLNLNPPSCCFAGPKGDSLYHWVATLIGPSGTPYEDGIFFLDITFPSEYPFKPPEAMDKQKQKQTDAKIGLESEVIAAEIVKQTATGK